MAHALKEGSVTDWLSTLEDRANLPSPVRRYFAFALRAEQPAILHAYLDQEGTFAIKRDAWHPFAATEHITAHPVGFSWNARISMYPLVSVRVRDAYANGQGSMAARIAGIFPLVNQRGTPELGEAALMRYLAEAVWMPTALLPDNGVTWEAKDDDSARATLVDGANRASLLFTFAADGSITRIVGERYRDESGQNVLRPWVGKHSHYTRIDGMMIPTEGEVGWVMPDGYFPYWRGKQVHARYEYATAGSTTLTMR